MKPKNDWKFNLGRELGDGYDVLCPKMPTSDDARYEEWRLWFERVLNEINEPVILVGHSLGAMFLTKYFTENTPKNTVISMHLIASEYEDPSVSGHPATSFTLNKEPKNLTQKANRVVFFHSKDDPVVSFENFDAFKNVLPDATFREFSDRGHFLDDTFPELVAEIQARN